MKRAISKTLGVLADSEAGWVDRRDAAVELGQGAVEAVRGLKTHEKDSDRDVQESIRQSLRDVGRAAAGIDLDAPSGGMPSNRWSRNSPPVGSGAMKREWCCRAALPGPGP